VHEKLLSLFSKAGYEVVYPEGLSASCCGMMFNSRGFKDAAAKKGAELEAALLKASEGGKWPIVCDTSPCLAQIKSGLSDPALRWVPACFGWGGQGRLGWGPGSLQPRLQGSRLDGGCGAAAVRSHAGSKRRLRQALPMAARQQQPSLSPRPPPPPLLALQFLAVRAR
jgi:hypothetical protein